MELRIMGDEYDVEAVTNKLRIQPTETWKMGDYIRNKDIRYKYTCWLYSTGEAPLKFKTQLEKIECLFLPKIEELCQLKDQYDLNFSFDIVICATGEEFPSVRLENPFMHLVDKLDARIDFDIYIN